MVSKECSGQTDIPCPKCGQLLVRDDSDPTGMTVICLECGDKYYEPMSAPTFGERWKEELG